MRPYPLIALSYAVLLSVSSYAQPCFKVDLSSTKTIYKSRVELHQRFDIETPNILAPAADESSIFKTFKNWVLSFAPTDQASLLRHQLSVLNSMPINATNSVWVANAQKRHLALLDGSIGKITPAACFERELFDNQLKIYPQMVYPSELMAILLRSKSNPNRYRVYFSIGDGKTFDVSPPQNTLIWEMMGKDLDAGWEFYAHIHSHPFMKNYDKAPHIGGTLFPSDEDLQGYQQMIQYGQYQMKEAWITNGFETVRFNVTDIAKLVQTLPAHPPYLPSQGRQ